MLKEIEREIRKEINVINIFDEIEAIKEYNPVNQ